MGRGRVRHHYQPPDLEQVTLSLAFPSWENWAGAGQGAGQRAVHHMRALDKALWLTSRAASSEVSPAPHQKPGSRRPVAGVLVTEVNE